MLEKRYLIDFSRLGTVAKKNDEYEYSPWYIPATGFGIDDRFLQNVI